MSKLRWKLRAAWRWLKSLRYGCDCCGAIVATRARQRTAYVDDARNWVTLCKRCHKENDAYWDDMWAEYYRGVL